MNLSDRIKSNIYFQLFTEFFALGLFTFGGGAAMIAMIQGIVTDKRHWLTEEETLDCIAICQSLPGVIAVNMSVFVGYKRKGLLGAIVSWIGMVLPSFVIIIVIAMSLGRIDDNPYVQGALTGIRAAATGLIAYITLKMAKSTLKSGKYGHKSKVFNWIMMVSAFALVAFFNVDAVYVILGAILFGIVFIYLMAKQSNSKEVEK